MHEKIKVNRRLMWLFGSVFLFVLVVSAVAALDSHTHVEQKQEDSYLPPVSIVIPEPGDHKGSISVYAEVKPRWEAMLTSHVSGEIVEVSSKALAGEWVDKGEWLIRVEDSSYRAALDEAKQVLAEASLLLQQSEKKSEQAETNWKRAGINKPATALALQKPQLLVARRTVEAATSRLRAAEKKLGYTRVTAPFSGFIKTRMISIGQTVNEGEDVLQLVNNEQLDIEVSLSKMQWSMLDKNWRNQLAFIRDSNGNDIASAGLKRGGGFLDPKTRQYKLFLEIDKVFDDAILPGDFVNVVLPGRVVKNSLAVPESALTRDGYIWYVDDEDYLRRFTGHVLLRSREKVIVDMPRSDMENKHYPLVWRIATTPLASFFVSSRVKVVRVAEL